jgi:hypothetical protein
MKLKEFIENLTALVKEHPEYLDLDVITSIDSEGNGFEHVHYRPSVGVLDDDGSFCSANSDDFAEYYEYTKENINAICVN